jgi:hypothetical protein
MASWRHGVTIPVRAATFVRTRGEGGDDVVQFVLGQPDHGVMTTARPEDREPGPAVRAGRQADSIAVHQLDPQRAIWMPVHHPESYVDPSLERLLPCAPVASDLEGELARVHRVAHRLVARLNGRPGCHSGGPGAVRRQAPARLLRSRPRCSRARAIRTAGEFRSRQSDPRVAVASRLPARDDRFGPGSCRCERNSLTMRWVVRPVAPTDRRYEELEETAKLHFILGDRPASPLNPEQIADLNRTFPS